MRTMRAKVVLQSVTAFTGCETLKFNAVAKSAGYPADGSDEDNSFARWSPTADFSITVTNPDLIGKLKPGQKFYVDFLPADQPEN